MEKKRDISQNIFIYVQQKKENDVNDENIFILGELSLLSLFHLHTEQAQIKCESYGGGKLKALCEEQTQI